MIYNSIEPYVFRDLSHQGTCDGELNVKQSLISNKMSTLKKILKYSKCYIISHFYNVIKVCYIFVKGYIHVL